MPVIPFAHQWTIPENKLLPLKESVVESLYSFPVSNIPEFEYYLQIFPNGDVEERRGQTWIFLEMEFNNVKKVEADFTFTIHSANFSQATHYIYEKSYDRGRIFICSTEEFYDPENKFFVDGKLTIKVNGIFNFKSEDVIPSIVQEQKWIGGELGNEFWKKDGTKDFTIITADEKEIKVHKYVLDVRSDVFTAMLNSNMKESNEDKLTIPDFSLNVVETGIKLIYECTFTSTLSTDELMSLLQFFDKYLLQTLKAKVELFLIVQISPSTVVRLTNASIQTNSFKLKEKCIEFLMNAFQSKTALADIDELDKDVLLEMLKNSLYGTLETDD